MVINSMLSTSYWGHFAVTWENRNIENMMGQLMLEERGQFTAQRILDAQLQKIEVSYTANGQYKGDIGYSEIATDWSVPAAVKNSATYGEGRSIITANDSESGAWKLQGVEPILPSGNRSLKGSAYKIMNQVNGISGKLAELDNVLVVFEYEVAQNGAYHGKAWQGNNQMYPSSGIPHLTQSFA